MMTLVKKQSRISHGEASGLSKRAPSRERSGRIMAEMKVISVLVNGGEATAGPPLGPQLGPLGVNVLGIVNEINRITADFKGMRVPVKIEVDQETKKFIVTVGTPTTS